MVVVNQSRKQGKDMTEAITRASVLAAFHSEFGQPARLFRAPARINIIGEHCDYNDGFVMPSNTALYTWLAIAPREDRMVQILGLDFNQKVEIDLGGREHMFAGNGQADHLKQKEYCHRHQVDH